MLSLTAAVNAFAGPLVEDARAWTPIAPAGATRCLDGSAYTFFHRAGAAGAPKRLVVEFEGGGACWDVLTCTVGTYTNAEVDVDHKLRELNKAEGVHSSTDSRNPFKDWDHVFVPYCTADAHGGNHSKDDGIKTVHHVGRVNALAALDYAFKAVAAPTLTATIGCSAGSLGAVINAPYVMSQYPSVRSFTFHDSYVGVLSRYQFSEAVKNWHLQFSPSIPALAPAELERVAADDSVDPGHYMLNSTLAATGEEHRFAFYTSDKDLVQRSFFALGGNLTNWTAAMRTLLGRLHAAYPAAQYSTFIASGEHHCRMTDDSIYKTSAKGVNLGDWMGRVVAGNLTDDDARVDCCA